MAHSPQNRTGTFQCIRLKHRTTPLRDLIGSGSAGPRYPLRDAVAPLALGSTWTVLWQSRRPKIGGGRTTGVAARDRSALPPEAGWLSVPVRRHPREVSSLSRGVMSQPLSGPLQAGLRFLPRPLPAAPSAHLAAGLPSREDDGLTTLHRRNPRGLGPAFTPVALHLRRGTLQPPDLATYRFGPSLSAPLACLCLRRLRRFT